MKLIDKCTMIAKLINNKGFRLARSEESQAFWKKVVGDYHRYGYEAADIIIDLKSRPTMEDHERKA